MTARIIFRHLFHRPLQTLLSLVLLMSGAGIISMLLLLRHQATEKFNNDLKDIDLVIGAKGSPLQLVLSAVYQLDAPTGNIPRADAERIMHHPLVEQAIPLAYGDSYKTFRIVGTDSNYLRKYQAGFREGHIFRNTLDAVIGSRVAAVTGLRPGATFTGTHGLGAAGHEHAEFRYKVTGILEESNTVLDNLVLTDVATVWKIHEHHEDAGQERELDRHEHHEPQQQKDDGHGEDAGLLQLQEAHGQLQDNAHHEPPAPSQQLTALLVKYRSPMAMVALPRAINAGGSMQAASPALEINRLFSLMGIGITTMQAIAFAIMLLSGLSVFTSLYTRLRERKYELALARSLGCSRARLFLILLSEGLLLSLGGFMAGILLSRAGLFLLDRYTAGKYHFNVFRAGLIPAELYLLGVTLLIGLLAGVAPALRACYLNISKTLANE